jgi:hypothetical protein
MSTPAVVPVSSIRTTSSATSLVLISFPALAFYRSYDLPNRNTRHFALRISWPFPVTIDSRIGQVRTFSHTDAVITCQEADFLHPSQIVGARGALPRVFASVII